MIKIQEFFDKDTSTLTYVIWDPKTRDALVLDPVWNYCPASSTLREESVGIVSQFIKGNELKLGAILETHAHADHVSGAQPLKKLFPNAFLGIGKEITQVQKAFKAIFDLPNSFACDGRQFDRLFSDGEKFSVGSIQIEMIFTPGHTPACGSYLIEDALFCGDAIFMPDYGTGRCDFPEGNAANLYDSISKRVYSLPESTRLFTCHDYQPNGRPLKFQSSIGEEKKENIQLNAKTSKESFVHFRHEKDKTLNTPKLLYPSVQLNINGGKPLPPHANGKHYLLIPLNFQPTVIASAAKQTLLSR